MADVAAEDAVSVRSELPCPVCGGPIPTDARFPAAVCGGCVGEAVDDAGRSLRFAIDPQSGDLQSYRREPDGRELLLDPPQQRCFVRGRACWADETYFGTVVVLLLRENASH